MKKLITFVICVALVLTLSVPALAKCDNTVYYLSNLFALSYNGAESNYGGACREANIPDNISLIIGGEASHETDLNRGCGNDSNYIRLIRGNSFDASEAIRDLVVLYLPVGEAAPETIERNDICYNVVGGYSIVHDYFIYNKAIWENVFGFNERHDGTCEYEVYLYYTKDTRAGEPITDLKFYFDYENRNQPNLIPTTDGEPANFNHGYGGRVTYLQILREQVDTGSVFAGSTSIAVVCAGVVVILAAGAFVIVKSKKKKQSV